MSLDCRHKGDYANSTETSPSGWFKYILYNNHYIVNQHAIHLSPLGCDSNLKKISSVPLFMMDVGHPFSTPVTLPPVPLI